MAVNASTLPGSLKSIQRGVATGNQAITISTVNPAKCLVFIAGGFGANTGSSSTTGVPYLSAISTTSITVAGAIYTTSTTQDLTYSWQVAEYY